MHHISKRASYSSSFLFLVLVLPVLLIFLDFIRIENVESFSCVYLAGQQQQQQQQQHLHVQQQQQQQQEQQQQQQQRRIRTRHQHHHQNKGIPRHADDRYQCLPVSSTSIPGRRSNDLGGMGAIVVTGGTMTDDTKNTEANETKQWSSSPRRGIYPSFLLLSTTTRHQQRYSGISMMGFPYPSSRIISTTTTTRMRSSSTDNNSNYNDYDNNKDRGGEGSQIKNSDNASNTPSTTNPQGYMSFHEYMANRKNVPPLGGPLESNPSSSSPTSTGSSPPLDRFMDWWGTSTSITTTTTMTSSPMVQPISIDGRPANIGPTGAGTTGDGPPTRVKARFGKLFVNMPSLLDIIGGNEDDGGNNNPPRRGRNNEAQELDSLSRSDSGNIKQQKNKVMDYSWFDDEKRSIMAQYDEMLHTMLNELNEQRRIHPESVPENAEAMITSVFRQEMERDINEKLEQRAMEMIQQDGIEQQRKLDAQDGIISGPMDSKVQQLMEQSEEEYRNIVKARAEMEAFLLYEQNVKERSSRSTTTTDDLGGSTSSSSSSSIAMPRKGDNLDLWALQRLQEMAQDGDNDSVVLDIIEDQMEDLENRLEKQSTRGTKKQPGTMKEWQMYRAIATRLAADDNRKDPILKPMEDSNTSNNNDDKIQARLDSWKSYIEKEDQLRTASGLSRGPKLPFEWQEYEQPQNYRDSRISTSGTNNNNNNNNSKDNAMNARKQINRMSIQAMESLLVTSSDPVRKGKLEKEIDFLKSTLESNDYLDVDESYFDSTIPEAKAVVDLTDIFIPYEESRSQEENRRDAVLPRIPSTVAQSEARSGIKSSFFEPDPNRGQQVSQPNTPFFSSEYDGDDNLDKFDVAPEDSKLGSMEDQLLESMLRRSGAQSIEQRDAIRRQWQQFQEAEKVARERSGLSGIDPSISMSSTPDLPYNPSAIMGDDGDFDANKILAAIGPRPKRTKTSTSSTVVANAQSDVVSTTSSSRGGDVDEVADSLFRAVSAVGGGRYKDDPDAQDKQQQAFNDYLNREREVRRSMDQFADNPSLLVGESVLGNGTFNDVEYAEEVLSNLGARPRPRRAKIVDERTLSDKGGVLSAENQNDAEEGDDDDDDDDEDLSSNPAIPEWLRRENEEAFNPTKGKSFSGDEIDDVFEDDDYEKKLRQLAEYERRRSGARGRTMGIDISDVLGKRTLESDDYADFKYDDEYFRGRQEDWGSSSFNARKANLLEYTELELVELNSLMDHKDSVYATGVSQYLPRINKPFKDFGAIFRLEGVLVDVVGLQIEAWGQVAKEFNCKTPEFDDIVRASVVRSDIAMKDVFGWTDDVLESRKIIGAHRKAVKNIFNNWASANGYTVKLINDVAKGNLAMGEEIFGMSAQKNDRKDAPAEQKLLGNEVESLRNIAQAWAATATQYGRNLPSSDDIIRASILTPDIVIQELFNWSRNPSEIDEIAGYFRLQLRNKFLAAPTNPDLTSPMVVKRERSALSKSSTLTQNDVMEMHYRAWIAIADKYGFQKPLPEEVLAAFVINDPRIAVRNGFEWTEDTRILDDVVHDFQVHLQRELASFALSPSSSQNGGNAPLSLSRDSSTVKSKLDGPSPDDIFQTALEAWKATAIKARLPPPDSEQVLFALSVGPEEGVVTGFEWTRDPLEAAKYVSWYQDELARLRSKWSDAKSSRETLLPLASKSSPSKRPDGPSQDEIFTAALEAWKATAWTMAFPIPDLEQVVFALSVGPLDAVITGFGWTDNMTVASTIVDTYKTELAKRRSKWQQSLSLQDETSVRSNRSVPLVRVVPGAYKWVKALTDVEMQCAVISHLDAEQVDLLLRIAGLDELIGPDKRVTADNGYGRDSQQMLGAALRLERRPDHCVVFDQSSFAPVDAHDVEMRSVGIIGAFPRYDLLAADTAASSFDDLTAMNIRRLFGERVYDQPMVDMQQAEPEKRYKKKTKFFWADD